MEKNTTGQAVQSGDLLALVKSWSTQRNKMECFDPPQYDAGRIRGLSDCIVDLEKVIQANDGTEARGHRVASGAWFAHLRHHVHSPQVPFRRLD